MGKDYGGILRSILEDCRLSESAGVAVGMIYDMAGSLGMSLKVDVGVKFVEGFPYFGP